MVVVAPAVIASLLARSLGGFQNDITVGHGGSDQIQCTHC